MSITVTSVNVNGIRAATRERSEENRGFLGWLETTTADIVCLQEVRATEKQALAALTPVLRAADDGAANADGAATGWYFIMQEAAAKGRAGVGILSRYAPTNVRTGFDKDEFADAGRYIEADFQIPDAAEDVITVGSLYLPAGEVDTPRQEEKMRFMEGFGEFLAQRTAAVAAGECPETIVCGDWNIAHREADLKNWKGNMKNSGFLPEERAWMTSLFGPLGQGKDADDVATGWVDAMRYLLPDEVGPYSWWSYRGKAFDNDAGWRIDYQAITPGLVERLVSALVERADRYDLRWSDHAPVTITYK